MGLHARLAPTDPLRFLQRPKDRVLNPACQELGSLWSKPRWC